MTKHDFQSQYGPWAFIAGSSVGLGAAFARELAAKGLNIVLTGRRLDPLNTLSEELKADYQVDVKIIQVDLASPDMLSVIKDKTSDIEIGLLIYNTAYMVIGSFFDHTIEEQVRHIAVNCRGPILLSHHFGNQMIKREKGGIILMTSLSAFQGAPLLATYGATKAFNLVLAEGLWYELKNKGIDVLACCAGSTATPNFISSRPNDLGAMAPAPLSPEQVANEAVMALGRRHLVIPGFAFRMAQFFVGFLPRKKRISIMGDSTQKMYGKRSLIINR